MSTYDPETDTFNVLGDVFEAWELRSKDCDIPLLRKHLEWVEEQAALPIGNRDWSQGVWARVVEEENVCRTYRCFAGNVVHEAGGEFIKSNNDWWYAALMPGEVYPREISDIARERLGLNSVAREVLFDETNTAYVIRQACEAIAGERL